MKKETSINDLSADLLQKIMKMYLNSMSPKGAERNQNLSRERYESHLILTKLQPVCRWWARVGFGLPQLNEPLQKVKCNDSLIMFNFFFNEIIRSFRKFFVFNYENFSIFYLY